MSKPDLHQKWIDTYIADSKDIYDLAFDEIKQIVWKCEGDTFLDAGCGNGVNTIRLVNRGFKVVATDFSDEALKLCNTNVLENNYEKNVSIQKEDLLNLSFKNDTFEAVLCWGVLMHIFEIEKALTNLCRVTKPNGYVVLCEVSQFAIDTLIGKVIKKFRLIEKEERIKSSFGVDNWTQTSAGRILVRKTNISKLIRFMDSKGFILVKYFPGQFSQFYTRMSNPILKKMILSFNKIWFKYIKLVSPSVEHILIFKKNDTN